jgi:hypothetical protein
VQNMWREKQKQDGQPGRQAFPVQAVVISQARVNLKTPHCTRPAAAA